MPQPKIHGSRAERQATYRQRRNEAIAAHAVIAPLPALPVLPTIPGTSRWRVATTHACDLLEQTVLEMGSYFDDRLEAWQASDRGENFQESKDALDAIQDQLSDWIQTYHRR